MSFVILKNLEFSSGIESNAKEYVTLDISKESCQNCHTQTTGYSEYHNPELIGCIACHLGNPNTDNKEESHRNMVLIPGNLSDAANTCGKCHTEELYKINHSLMTTNSGLVAVDKFIFGEAHTPDSLYHIKDVQFSGADKHIRNLCANCHLGAEKKEFGKINQLSRGGGCNACHLNYSEGATADLKSYVSSGKNELPKIHPSSDIFVTDEHCFGCHSRSSRISTNYQGWHETLLEMEDVLDNEGYKTFEDGRIYSYQNEDVHHAKGMLCIDCHSSHEVMGDGKTYLHQEDAVKIQCADCHFDGQPNTITYDELDRESKLVFLHRDYKHTDKQIIVTEKDKNPLVNTYVENDEAFLIGKKDSKLHLLSAQSEICSRDNAHKNVSCSSCHTQWAPKCIGCHNVFDQNDKKGYDLLDKKEVIGQWSEHVFEFGVSQPAMGVREKGGKREIQPAIPGMIMTIDNHSVSDKKDMASFHRLYAPNAPHTTTKEVRDCKSCHNNPEAIGYGKGTLVYNMENGRGQWQFTPAYEFNVNDGLPEDAWVGFLNEKNQNEVNTTRTDFRPFTIKEQKRLLLVGSCLQCHNQDSKIMQQTLIKGLAPLLLKINKACVLPSYHN